VCVCGWCGGGKRWSIFDDHYVTAGAVGGALLCGRVKRSIGTQQSCTNVHVRVYNIFSLAPVCVNIFSFSGVCVLIFSLERPHICVSIIFLTAQHDE